MRKVVAPITAVVLIGLVVWSYIYFKDYRPIGTDDQLMKPPQILLEVEGIKLAGRSNGKPVWRMHADRLLVGQSRLTTTLQGIHGGEIYENGKPAASLQAGQASYDSIRRSLYVSGGVKVKGRDGSLMQTTVINYDGVNRRIICPERVKIVRGSSSGSVDKLTADLANDSVEASNLRMRVATKDIPDMESGSGN